MTNNLFKKAVVFGDIHFGLKGNSTQHNEDCLNYVKWMIETAKENGCETCLFLGDYHHNRSSINLRTLNYSVQALKLLNDAFEKTYVIIGNHDLFFRDKRDIHGVEWGNHLPNIEIINSVIVKDNVAIVPWLIGDDYKRVQKIKAKYMFGHFELPHFKMNALVEMPDTGQIDSRDMGKVDHVYSGHFHLRQTRGNVTYIGNAFPHNFADVGDNKRGCMMLEWGEEPTFVSWPGQPLYTVCNLSELIDHGDDILTEHMYVKVNIDIPISYEESNFLKETFLTKYKLRDISLIPVREKEYEEDNAEAITFNSIDTIIGEQIQAIESEFYKPDILMKIYNEL